ncbi:MAG: hypothetical protein HY513_06020 [Candidatus Aenigmarchaeota archaeon]|nr:hypothetical protein [Candidatus Aenigmarchaeota archaeon]
MGFKRTKNYHIFEAIIVALFLSLSAFAQFPTTGYQTASGAETSDKAAAAVETVILVNSGDKSAIDASIAASISEDRGIPVLYTGHKDVPTEVLSELLTGDYKDVKNVIIIGGDSVVSDSAQTSLEQVGESAGYDVTRIAGATATGTAVEAIKYFYGPEMLHEITLVEYNGDSDKSQQEYLHLSSELGGPIIPVPSGIGSLPADIAQAINDIGINGVTLVGDVEDSVKAEIKDLGADIRKEFAGTQEELAAKMEAEVKDSIVSGDNIILVEERMVPPILPGYKVFFYRDENNDNIDDDTGSVLDGIGRGLYNDIQSQLGAKPKIKFISDDEGVQKQFEQALSLEGIKVEAGSAGDPVRTAVIFAKDEIAKIEERFEQKQEDFQKRYEQNKRYFEEKLPLIVDQFEAYYTDLDKSALPPQSLELASKIIDEKNKGDALAQWKLVSAFANSYRHETYISCNDACKQEYVESEREGVDRKLEKLVGIERAKEVANLEKGKKIGLLGTDDLVPPNQVELLRGRYAKVFEKGTDPENLHEEFVKNYKQEAYETYREEIKQEYTISKSGTDPAKWDDNKLKEEFERRLQYESEAYQSGLLEQPYFSDPEKRAEIFSTLSTVDTTLRNSGVPDTAYLTATEWKAAYDKYKSGGKLAADDIKAYEVAVTAYKTYENQHEGGGYSPQGGSYNAKTGQFSYVDPVKEALVAGSYNSDTKQYTYVNDEGKLVQGTSAGEVHEYAQNELPSGYKYDDKAGSFVYQSTGKSYTYTPPAEYNEKTGTYQYEYVNPSTGSTYTYSNSYSYTPPSPTDSDKSSNVAGSATGVSTPSYTGASSTTITTTDSGGATTSTSYSGGDTGSYSGGSTGTYSGGTSGSYSAPSGGSTPSGGGDSGGGYSAPAPSAPSGGDGGGGAPPG